ncbi:Flavin-dependent oxidoreductase, luciferase family (includes alkanesulfonate monooxygenase SsuD and methylene tetrahydromethanopterin reductase) [Alteribacillus persepolensis]|uniref:Flavin-dependent oxidoreductase, luciferase family (Includes alkanesulfonate monooxygenase SsuD and methylene tetrahydromethanopterin reductase) n=1 Tax=Alteribacillus persepolensis TaxID=568899 RepID=A0A1G8HRT2_9BACI|nr:LLM class flavin-dependent oxidoreductase [Alteribacillus persepolensis]SDI09339.1 Flavin-dependent oxidoreductase, luciferase family (includes alkanesulfonate monooxygenase SsuD and methylene tetrahydromethanopterin reductase) [Alteribacillus persepolensis]
MKIGMFYVNECHDGKHDRAYREMLEQIQYGEELGFESVWLAEHHFNEYGSMPSPAVAASAIAQLTKKIDIGIAVSILNFNNPVRIAEDYAMVDILSEGRLKFGSGRGYQPKEAKGLGISMENSREKYWEAVEIIQGLWSSNESFSYYGRHYQVEDIVLTPKPIQERIPFYYAAISAESFDYMVEKGAREFMVTPTLMVLDEVMRYTKQTRERLIQKGITPDILLNLQMHIADDPDEAVRNVEKEMQVYFNRVLSLIPGADGQPVPKSYEQFAEVAKTFNSSMDIAELDKAGIVLLDNNKNAIDRLAAVEEAGITNLSCWFRMGGMEHNKVMKQMKRFAEEVLPYIKKGSAQKTGQ